MKEKGYPTIKLGEAVDRITKGTTPTTHGFKYTTDGIAFVRVENLRNGVIDTSGTATFISSEANHYLQRSRLETGDVLVSIAGTIGRVAVVRSHDLPANTNQAVAIIRGATKRFVPTFLRYALENPALHKQIIHEARGGAMQNISLEDVRSFQVPIPHLEEQQQIVAEIEKQFTRLEAGVAALKRAQANLKRYRAAILKAACEGRLVPTEVNLARKEGRTYETGEQLLAGILTKRHRKWQGRSKYKEPAAPDTVNLPPLPQGWTWATVEQLAAIEPNAITDGPFGSNLKTEHYTHCGPRVIRLQNIGEGFFTDVKAHISDSHFARLQKHQVFANDIVIAGLGENPPRACLIPPSLGPAIVKADCIRFKPHEDIEPKYVNISINSDPVRRRVKNIVHGVGRPRLNLGEIKAIVLPVPPLAEQSRIVAEVERRLSVVEGQEAMVAANLQRAAGLRQSILQRAFSGGLVYKGLEQKQ